MALTYISSNCLHKVAATLLYLVLVLESCSGFFESSPNISKYPFDETKVELPWYKDTWLTPKQVRNRVLLDYSCECGVENTLPGTEEYPWVVWITFWKRSSDANTKYEIKCGGSLINSLMILTNAQCVDKFKFALSKAFYQWDNQRVNVYMDSEPTPSATSIPIVNVIFHPDYSRGNLDKDVAILQLQFPVPFKNPKNAIRPICIPGPEDKFKEGSMGGVVLQYMDGVNNTDEVIPQNATTAFIYHINECKKMFKIKMHGKFICAAPPTQLSSRHFGSLLYTPLANDQNLQIGIWSSRLFGPRKKESSTLNLFIRIRDIIPFIEEVSSNTGAKWCRHPRMKLNDTTPESRLSKKNKPWVGTTSNDRDIDPSCSCGYRKATQQSRIVGGKEALPYEYPWMVLLQMDGGGISEGCGAAVINDLFILTAAHCVYDATLAISDPSNLYPGRAPTSIAAAIMIHSSEIVKDKNAVVLEIEEIFMHPEFTESVKGPPYIMDYDLALLKLKSRLQFWSDDGPLPICLPTSEEVMDIMGREAIVAGWGMSNPDNPDESLPGLQELKIPVKSLQECKDLAVTPVTERMLCAGTFNPQKDTLHGDSGGPLMFELPSKQIMQIGLVSWGDYDVRKEYNLDTQFAAALYTDVKVLLDYIDYYSKLRSAKWCKREVPAENPRQPWIGANLPARNISSSCVCGVRGERDTSGNTISVGNEMPWLVLITAVRESSTTYCTGSIINDLYVISSADCLKADKLMKHGNPAVPTNVVHMQPMFEQNNIIDFQSTLIIDTIHLYPDYLQKEEQFDHDIALIKLKHRINFKKERLAPICVPTFKEAQSLNFTKAKSALMTGWTKVLSEGQTYFQFNVIKQKLMKNSACGNQTFVSGPKKFLCLESPTNLEPSMAGGPVQMEISETQLLQIGIIPAREQKQPCVKPKKKKHKLSTEKHGSNSTAEKPTQEGPEVTDDDSANVTSPVGRAVPFQKIQDERSKTLGLVDIDIIDDHARVKKDETVWKPQKIPRDKRGAERECSMYTSMEEGLQFIEFYTSHDNAVWCDQEAYIPKSIKQMESAEDFGLEA